jgi:hypothetical protein
MFVNELKGDQRRQLVDTQQVFDAWRETAYESPKIMEAISDGAKESVKPNW